MNFHSKLAILCAVVAFCTRMQISSGGDVLPHCTFLSVGAAKVLKQNFDSAEVFVEESVRTELNVAQTVCIRFDLPEDAKLSNDLINNIKKPSDSTSEPDGIKWEKTILYAFRYSDFQHNYPVKYHYDFGIPQIQSACICDCEGGADHCSASYQYRNCTKADVCVTSYHPFKSPRGCESGFHSQVCCEVFMTPRKHQKFTALHLGHPTASVLLHESVYVLYESGVGDKSRSEISLIKKQKYRVVASGSQTIRSADNIRLSVKPEPSPFRLESGMKYFTPWTEEEDENVPIYTGLSLNEFQEWDLGKLGFFRVYNDRWFVKNANLKIPFVQHIVVEDCKAQSYKESYDVNFYNMDPVELTSQHATTVQDYYSFIKDLRYISIAQRSKQFLLVTLSIAPTIHLSIDLRDTPNVSLTFHNSILSDFEGAIKLDKFSHRFLNLTLVQSKGSMSGSVYNNKGRLRLEASFSFNIDSDRPVDTVQLIQLPISIQGAKWVCLQPSTNVSVEKCRQVAFYSEPSSWFIIPSKGWEKSYGDCQGCNDQSGWSLLRFFNPAQWFSGVHSVAEGFAMTMEVLVWIVAVLVAFAICRRCVWPLVNWSVCTRVTPTLRLKTCKQQKLIVDGDQV